MVLNFYWNDFYAYNSAAKDFDDGQIWSELKKELNNSNAFDIDNPSFLF